MKAEKDKKTGKWLIQFRYTDWQGIRRKTTKRGFATKREAEEYVRNFLASQQADFNMAFEDFLELQQSSDKSMVHTLCSRGSLEPLYKICIFHKQTF